MTAGDSAIKHLFRLFKNLVAEFDWRAQSSEMNGQIRPWFQAAGTQVYRLSQGQESPVTGTRLATVYNRFPHQMSARGAKDVNLSTTVYFIWDELQVAKRIESIFKPKPQAASVATMAERTSAFVPDEVRGKCRWPALRGWARKKIPQCRQRVRHRRNSGWARQSERSNA